jgi:hypothetical protein
MTTVASRTMNSLESLGILHGTEKRGRFGSLISRLDIYFGFLKNCATMVLKVPEEGRSVKPFTVHRSPFTVHRSPFTVHRSPFTVHRSPFAVRCSLFAVRRSPFAVRRFGRSPFAVWRSPFVGNGESVARAGGNPANRSLRRQVITFHPAPRPANGALHTANGEQRTANPKPLLLFLGVDVSGP